MKKKSWRIWSEITIESFLKKIKSNYKLHILCPEEYEINSDFKYKNLVSRCKNAEVVFGSFDIEWYKKNTDILEHENIKLSLWKNYFLYHSIGFWDRQHRPKEYPITTLFTCMNHRPHEHRIRFVDELAKNNLLEDNYLTWHFIRKDVVERFKYWKPRLHVLDSVGPPKQDSFPDEMYCSLLDVITETNSEVPFLTEKTFNAIIYKKPFIIYGYPKSHQQLEEMGFKLPRNIIDYSFDDIVDSQLRCEAIVKELLRLSKLNYQELHEKMQDIVLHNQKHAFNIARNRYGIPKIIFEDNYYKYFLGEVKCKLDLLESEN